MKIAALAIAATIALLAQPHTAIAGKEINTPLTSVLVKPAEVHITLANTFASRYWGSIVGGIFYTGGPVNFTDLTFTIDDNWGTTYLLIGMINPLDTTRYDYGGGTEYYLGVGKTFDLWKGGPKNLPLVKLNAFVLYDAISKIERFDDDVIQELLRIDLPRVPFAQPYVEGYLWQKSGKKAPPVGWFGRAGIHRQQPLGFSLLNSAMELGIDLSAGYSGEGLFGADEGLAYYRAVISTEIKVNDHFVIIPDIVFQLPGHGQQDKGRAFIADGDPKLFYDLSFKWEF